MKFAALNLAFMVCSFAAPAFALEPIKLPSGSEVTFHDVIWGEPGPMGLTIRFRFLDPDLADKVDRMDFVDMEADTAFLCESYALQRISTNGPRPNQIIISVADREVPFGEQAPDATQIFEAYSFDGTVCQWEGF